MSIYILSKIVKVTPEWLGSFNYGETCFWWEKAEEDTDTSKTYFPVSVKEYTKWSQEFAARHDPTYVKLDSSNVDVITANSRLQHPYGYESGRLTGYYLNYIMTAGIVKRTPGLGSGINWTADKLAGLPGLSSIGSTHIGNVMAGTLVDIGADTMPMAVEMRSSGASAKEIAKAVSWNIGINTVLNIGAEGLSTILNMGKVDVEGRRNERGFSVSSSDFDFEMDMYGRSISDRTKLIIARMEDSKVIEVFDPRTNNTVVIRELSGLKSGQVKVKDLAKLQAATGNEYMLLRHSEKGWVLIEGVPDKINLPERYIGSGWTWSGHSHPVSRLFPSDDDRLVLRLLEQDKSVIISAVTGEQIAFEGTLENWLPY